MTFSDIMAYLLNNRIEAVTTILGVPTSSC